MPLNIIITVWEVLPPQSFIEQRLKSGQGMLTLSFNLSECKYFNYVPTYNIDYFCSNNKSHYVMIISFYCKLTNARANFSFSHIPRKQ